MFEKKRHLHLCNQINVYLLNHTWQKKYKIKKKIILYKTTLLNNKFETITSVCLSTKNLGKTLYTTFHRNSYKIRLEFNGVNSFSCYSNPYLQDAVHKLNYSLPNQHDFFLARYLITKYLQWKNKDIHAYIYCADMRTDILKKEAIILWQDNRSWNSYWREQLIKYRTKKNRPFEESCSSLR